MSACNKRGCFLFVSLVMASLGFAAEEDAVFTPSAGRLDIPSIAVGAATYRVQLQLSGTNPIRFELASYSRIDDAPNGSGAAFADGLVDIPVVQVLANDYRAQLRHEPSSDGKLRFQLMGIEPRKMRAVHSGGNWGMNFHVTREEKIADGYFDYLRSMHVDWVGVSVALSIDDSMDSTVERRYGNEFYTTYDDAVLRKLIRTIREQGFNVYLTLAFEIPHAETAARPVRRWQIGNPRLPSDDPATVIKAENWPWSPSHPNHAAFVQEFFRTYTDEAVYYARLAQEEGVRLYSLGTETQLLFRSRSGSYYTNDFRDELVTMVQQVRKVFHGAVTYDMSYQDLLYQPDESKYLWSDLGLDVIGISAYFELATSTPTGVLSQQYFEGQWDEIFRRHLQPIADVNPGKTILFTEFGYVDSVQAPALAAAGLTKRTFADADGNGLDDGEEMQRNIYAALFAVMEKYPRLLNGLFFWDTQLLDDARWNSSYHEIREFTFRQKLSENVVREQYDRWKR